MVLGVVALAVGVLGSGCGNKEEKKAAHLKKAREYSEKGELKKAVVEYKNVMQLDPQDDGVFYELGEAYVKLKQGNEALGAFGRAASINPDNMKAQLKVGQLFLLGRKTEEARKKAELVLEKSPENIEGLMLLSGVQMQEKDIDGAAKTIERAAAIDPNQFNVQLSLARIYFLKKDFGQAEKAYKKAIELEAASRVSYIELARIYGIRGEWEKAEAAFKKMIEATGESYQSLLLLARFYESRGVWEQAEENYKKAVSGAPREDVVPLMNLASYYGRRKSYDKALEQIEKAAEIRKNDLNILVSKAQLQFDFRKIKEAEGTLNKVLEKDPKNLAGLIALGTVYDHKGEGERAEPYYRKAMEIRKDFGPAANNLAWNLVQRGVNLDEALKLAQIAREQIPGNPAVTDTLGWIHYLKGDYVKAISEFEESVARRPGNPVINYHMGLAYYKGNEPEKAREFLRRALSLDPHLKGTEEAQRILKTLGAPAAEK